MKFKFHISVLSVLFFIAFATAQNRQALERKRASVRKEIREISKQLEQLKKGEANELSIYNLLNRKIKLKRQIIRNLNYEIRLLNKQIQHKQDSIARLENELLQLKKEYAGAVRKAYKYRSNEKLIYFILSAESFTQVWRRLRYIKEYSSYLKKQAEEIKQKKAELKQAQKRLEIKKNQKAQVLTNLKDEEKELALQQKEQQKVLEKLRKQKTAYIRQIKEKERQLRKIDRLIEKIIAKEIAKTNRAKGSRNKSVFVLTPEGKKLAGQFSANKGRLPWPVKRGYVSRRFGTQPHPVYKNIKITSSGIHINTPDDEPVKAVFDGEVMMIQLIPGANQSVYVRHGNYITIYGNLKKISVKKGQKIKRGQLLGIVAKDPMTNISVLKFKIYKNRTKLNPLLWLSRK